MCCQSYEEYLKAEAQAQHRAGKRSRPAIVIGGESGDLNTKDATETDMLFFMDSAGGKRKRAEQQQQQ